MNEYSINTSDIIQFRGRLFAVSKHYKGTRRVTLVPVLTTERGRVFVTDGKPRVFKAATVEREARFHQNFDYQTVA